ncbi:hypothetical protein GE09DRAFT_673587 [Coniochaeta sp. 2T2.1]|nr:hypothetical protein GE09DRAFT_673587 [Coniochaeta sp. 2T2.1]
MPARLRAALLATCLFAATARAQVPVTTTATAPALTTVPVFLPGYGPGDWDALRGSIIASDSEATTYTLFCPTPPSCVLDTDFPLSFAEGTGTLRFDGTKSGEFTAHLSCNLAGSTAATCTGSSTYGTDFREGSITGPTQTEWTSTLTGSELRWGVLTLTTPPAQPATTNLDDPTPVDSATGAPPTSSVPNSAVRSSVLGRRLGWSFLASFVGAVAFVL